MERLRPQMKQIARYAIECGYGRMKYRSHSFELFGLDYMLDENLTVRHLLAAVIAMLLYMISYDHNSHGYWK